jgi:hypothetical protein
MATLASATATARPRPVTKADIEVLQRARDILDSPAKWNRHDDRNCERQTNTFSLYCAIKTASREIPGNSGAVMQEARVAISEMDPKELKYKTHLTDYNNDPAVTFADLQKFLRRSKFVSPSVWARGQSRVGTGECIVAPRPQTVAVGAGDSFERLTSSGSTPHYGFVGAAFTPVITSACQLQVYYWGVSDSGMLTLQSTTTPTEAGDFGQVAASMLQGNTPITSYTGGTGDNNVFLEWYKGFTLLDTSSVSYSDP